MALIFILSPCFLWANYFDLSSIEIRSGDSRNYKSNDFCSIPDFSLDQRNIYQNILKIYTDDTLAVRRKLEKGKKELKIILANTSIVTSGFAVETSEKNIRNENVINKARASFFNIFYYKVLIASQRKAFLKCLVAK